MGAHIHSQHWHKGTNTESGNYTWIEVQKGVKILWALAHGQLLKCHWRYCCILLHSPLPKTEWTEECMLWFSQQKGIFFASNFSVSQVLGYHTFTSWLIRAIKKQYMHHTHWGQPHGVWGQPQPYWGQPDRSLGQVLTACILIRIWAISEIHISIEAVPISMISGALSSHHQ